MKVTDILNRGIVNLTNCEQEPIHIPGSIQPHGFLLGLSGDEYTIEFASGNCADYIAYGHTQLLGKTFSAIFGAASEGVLKLSASGNVAAEPFPITIDDKYFLCSVHQRGDTFIFEAEPAGEAEKFSSDAYRQTRQFLSYMEHTSSLQQLCASVARGTREITGYDRVMIYRFDEQYNGEVFAEAKRDDLEPFLGLFYPHTDIPVQARQLYMTNLLRLIADINYQPVPIYTIDNGDRTNKDLDMSLCVLRSTSPIHVQYLQNMGVGATLTISLIHNNRLWGLIACHHYSAKNITPPVRLAAQLQGHFITSQIDVRQTNEEYDVSRRVNEALEQAITATIALKRLSLVQIAANEDVLRVCNAAGLCIIVNGVLYKGGLVPADAEIEQIVARMRTLAPGASFNSSHLAASTPEVENMCVTVAGVIYHPLDIADRNCIIWFRPQTIREVNWAGDPNKAIIKDANGLHPRKSFELWKEVVKCRSKPWLRPELNAAANYANALQKHVTYLALEEEERRYKRLSEVLKESNEELENINWISTHDLQEPLRKIQLMASRILSEDDTQVADSELVRKMNDSANKMQMLLSELLDHSKVKNTKDAIERVKVEGVLKEVMEQLHDMELEKMAKIVVGPLPEINGIPVLLKQLFVNLLTNALKFTSEKHAQVITIVEGDIANAPGLPEEGDYIHIVVADTGIGFDPKFSETMFRIFTRLNPHGTYPGTGMGLALCKKIMQSHKGYIAARGVPGEGAEFHLYFPAEPI
ncbi:MAG: ATP-binding protein [Bacteroidota bacterium]